MQAEHRSWSSGDGYRFGFYDKVIGFNHPWFWDVLKSVNGFKTTMWSQYTWQTWLSFFETALGNKNTWDQLFIEMPNTQSSWLSDVKTNEAQAFLFYAMLELEDEVLLRSTVSSMTGKTIEDWLDAIEAQYGVEYTNSLKGAVGINDDDPYWRYKLAENHVYGSSRLGLVERNLVLVKQVSGTSDTLYYSHLSDSIKSFYRGQKRYELSNHLGNVLAVITDRRIQSCNVAGVMHYDAQVVSVSDYYPFGMGIKEREWKDSTFSYRFGFNGKEQDDEVSGSGNSYDFGARMYNSRLGRWMSVDELSAKYPFASPYNFVLNTPIQAIDPDGKDVILLIWGTGDGSRGAGHFVIAISNYKEVKTKVKENGVWLTKTTMVPDGSYTVRDFWPKKGTAVGKSNYTRDIDGTYSPFTKGRIFTKEELLNSDVTDDGTNTGEKRPADGLIEIETTYERDQMVNFMLDRAEESDPKYNGIDWNCSDYCEVGVNWAAGVSVQADEKAASGKQLTTPNQLYKAAERIPSAVLLKDGDKMTEGSTITGISSNYIKSF
jgi:RHS repeat-associated protein